MGEVQLSDDIEILMFLSVGPFFEEGEVSRKFWPEDENLGIFSIEVL